MLRPYVPLVVRFREGSFDVRGLVTVALFSGRDAGGVALDLRELQAKFRLGVG